MGATAEKTQRRTVQKAAIREALERSPTFVSAQDLHTSMRGQGVELGLATVYRNLNELAAAGEADVLQASSNMQLYRSCSQRHHHHLYCIECGLTVEVEAPVEDWVEQVAADHGFSRVRHVVDIFGVCENCQARAVG